MNDFKLNDNNLVFKNGDIAIGESNETHVEHLLISRQGEWKQSPLVGCDIWKAKNGNITRMLDRHIRIQLEADGFQLESMNISPEGINIKGQYHEKEK